MLAEKETLILQELSLVHAQMYFKQFSMVLIQKPSTQGSTDSKLESEANSPTGLHWVG